MGRRKVFTGLVLSLIFVYLILWKPHLGALFSGDLSLLDALFGDPRLDFDHLGQILSEVHLWPIVICFFLTPVHVLIRSHRWALMVRNMSRLSLYDSFSLQMVGYLSNSILPLRMGEVVRGVMLAQRQGIPTSSGIGSVLVERILDMISLLVVVLVVSFLFPFPQEFSEATTILGLISVIGIAISIYFAVDRDPFGGKVGKILGSGKFAELIREKGGEFTAGFSMFRETKYHTVIIIETFAIWMVYVVQGYLIILAFDFPTIYPTIGQQPFLSAFVVLVIDAIGVSLPSAPAGVGTFHAVLIFGLSLLDVAADHAAGFALVIHAVSVIFYIVFGLPFMWREGLHLSTLKKIEESELKSKSRTKNK